MDPTIYIDGNPTETSADANEGLRIQVGSEKALIYAEDDAASEPLDWCNSASITIDPEDDEVSVSISTGDPRGAFVMTVRRLADGQLIMHLPHPGEPMPHEKLTRVSDSTYDIG